MGSKSKVKPHAKKESEVLIKYRDALVLAKSENNTLQVKLLQKIIKRLEKL